VKKAAISGKKALKPGSFRPARVARPPVVRRLLWLWLSTLGLSLAVMVFNPQWGLSLLWGSSVSLLPAICFARYAFRYRGASYTLSAVGAFYRGEALKYFLTLLLFAAVFIQVAKIHAVVFFLAFISVQIFSWLLTAHALGQRQR
jgi:ATP synthase protein I